MLPQFFPKLAISPTALLICLPEKSLFVRSMDKQEMWKLPLKVRSKKSRSTQMLLAWGKLAVLLTAFSAIGFGSLMTPARGQTPPSNPNPLAPTLSPPLPRESESVSETGGENRSRIS
ncbi:hypothetical protein [[Phormidium] sp. ETS-05]|uniref:hypothetical protein n=1 Tax=[Phormidium] sp. ETS-05 TaxID=222819 RepID=UPI0018EEF2E5|nr:hypothetical protein [[Phormidium] sp. ETS-05]